VDNATAMAAMGSTTVCSTRLDGMALMLDASPIATSQSTTLARTFLDDDEMWSTQRFPTDAFPLVHCLVEMMHPMIPPSWEIP